MALVTFMSDFGTEDHYVAAVKATLLMKNPELRIVDISHHIKASDLAHASFVLKSVFRDFPEGTVHLAAVDLTQRTASGLLAMELENHFFVGHDCGLFSLISNQQPTRTVALNTNNPVQSTFEARDILAPAAAALAEGENLKNLGIVLDDFIQLYPRQLKVTKKEIAGNIIRVDGYGNLITNINKPEFETIDQINGHKGYQVCFGREKTGKINLTFSDVESGEYYVLFNSNGLLQIGINKGNASELLGLYLDSPVQINFQL